ncbi:MAG TPA: hypothetical protein VF054_21140 [Micromonosporaceae bacterium]
MTEPTRDERPAPDDRAPHQPDELAEAVAAAGDEPNGEQSPDPYARQMARDEAHGPEDSAD